jgi:hypothetical protein
MPISHVRKLEKLLFIVCPVETHKSLHYNPLLVTLVWRKNMKKLKSLLFVLVCMTGYQSFSQTQVDPKSILKGIFLSINAPASLDVKDIDMSPAVEGSLKALASKGYEFGTGNSQNLTLEELKAHDYQANNVLVIVKENNGTFQGVIRMYRPIDSGNGIVEAANVYIFIYGSVEPKSGKPQVQKFEVNFKGVS